MVWFNSLGPKEDVCYFEKKMNKWIKLRSKSSTYSWTLHLDIFMKVLGQYWTHYSTHWDSNKMDATLQTAFSNAFSEMKIIVFWFNCHWQNLVDKPALSQVNGWVPNRWQAITWAMFSQVLWCYMTLLCHNELTILWLRAILFNSLLSEEDICYSCYFKTKLLHIFIEIWKKYRRRISLMII